jgi:Na+-translocating ferredoxin:NAD+ oxidoreductase subunit B
MLPAPPSSAAFVPALPAGRADGGAPRPTAGVDAIDAVLPQTQCTRCGYAGCRPYAQAIVDGDAINRCPPGGEGTIAALARLTGRAIVALDPAHGEPGPLNVARIDEAWCIGCTLCIDACPVDAIAGGPKRMHTVLPALCTGCALCLPPCPVDCIDMIATGRSWADADAAAARGRFDTRNRRHASAAEIDAAAIEVKAKQNRKAAVAAALQRARARRGAASGGTL